MSTALTRFLFRPPYQAQAPTTAEVVGWWEARRPAYNVAVGTAGLLTVGMFTAVQAAFPGPVEMVPWQAVLAYGVLANVCYSLGPVVDAIVCRRWGARFAAVGPALFRYGLVFAVGLTLLPIPFAAVALLVRLGSLLL